MTKDIVPFFNTIKGSIFGRLTAQVMLYRQLFEEPATQQMLEDSHAAAGLFKVFKRTLMETTVIGLGRLLDAPEGQTNRENLSLKALECRLSNAGETNLARNIDTWFKQNSTQIKDVKKIRNRYIGHLDAQTYQGQDQLPQFTHEDVLELFDEIDELMNRLDKQLTDSATDYGWIGMPRGDGGALKVLVDKAQKYQNLMEQIDEGKVTRESILPHILRDFGWPHSANLVERGDMRNFPHW